MLNADQKYRAQLLYDYYGEKEQRYQAIQELAECIVALTKGDRVNQIDELADASIMIQQMVYGLSADREVVDRIEYKIKRQEERIWEKF